MGPTRAQQASLRQSNTSKSTIGQGTQSYSRTSSQENKILTDGAHESAAGLATAFEHEDDDEPGHDWSGTQSYSRTSSQENKSLPDGAHESAAGLATAFEHEYPGKAGLFWVLHEHVGGSQRCG